MSKTLVIQYLPCGERSNTKKILDAFLAKIKAKTEIEVLDLIAETPPLFLSDNLMAYVLRDMAGEKISTEQQKLLEPADKLIKQLQGADNIVFAFPTYNFSLPAVVKAWFDQVMLASHTFKYEDGKPVGLLEGRKALIINSSGMAYEAPEVQGMEHSLSLGKLELNFMGITAVELVSAAGVNMQPPEEAEQTVAQAVSAAEQVAEKWFA
ncbi:MAG: NAD(P)H-dependent oxidoreductase [Patescibacteria group bacterium]